MSRILLLVLIVITTFLFWRRFGFVVREIRTARPDRDQNWGSLARRAWTFFSEVVCQSKVIKERPLPGLAHAFVFWSFCAFALVTVNHLAMGFGVPFLSRESLAGRFYYWFALAFAVACAISIAGLAFRRFVIRPKPLGPGPVSYQ